MKIVLHNSMRSLRLLPLAALCVVAVVAQAAEPQPAMPAASMPSGNMPHADMHPAAPATNAPKKSMMMGMDSMDHMPMSGDPDKDFATMMKMHHQRAVDMSEMELKNGKSPAMKAMATRIIAAQKKEIAQLEQWLAKQK